MSFHVSLEVSFIFELSGAHLTGVSLLLRLRGGDRPGQDAELAGEDAALSIDDNTSNTSAAHWLELDDVSLSPVLSHSGHSIDNVDSDRVGRSHLLRSRLNQILLPVNLRREHVVLSSQGDAIHVIQRHRQGIIRVVSIDWNVRVEIVLIESSRRVEKFKLRNLLVVVR